MPRPPTANPHSVIAPPSSSQVAGPKNQGRENQGKHPTCILCQWSLLRYAYPSCALWPIHPDSDRSNRKLATGMRPFPTEGDAVVIGKVLRGRRPQKPKSTALGITPAVWNVAKKCWRKSVQKRPEVREVLQELEKIGQHDVSGIPTPVSRKQPFTFSMPFLAGFARLNGERGPKASV